MGFSLGKTIGAVAGGGSAAGALGAVGGSAAGERLIEGTQNEQREKQKSQMLKDLKDQEDQASANSIDPRVRGYGQEQMNLSNQFRSNMGNTANDLSSHATTNSRLGLAQNLQGVRQAASSRGLLYSGLRQGQEAQARGQAAQDLAGQRYETNLGLENQARGYEQNALQAANTTAGAEQGLAEALSGRAITSQQQRGQAIGQLGAGVGQGAGLLVGSMKNKAT